MGTLDKVSDYNTVVSTKRNGETILLFPVHMQQKFKGSEKNNFNAMYQFNDKLDLLYNHNESTNRWAYKYSGIPESNKYAGLNGKARYNTKFERDGDFVQLNLHDMDGFSGHIFYNYNSLPPIMPISIVLSASLISRLILNTSHTARKRIRPMAMISKRCGTRRTNRPSCWGHPWFGKNIRTMTPVPPALWIEKSVKAEIFMQPLAHGTEISHRRTPLP